MQLQSDTKALSSELDHLEAREQELEEEIKRMYADEEPGSGPGGEEPDTRGGESGGMEASEDDTGNEDEGHEETHPASDDDGQATEEALSEEETDTPEGEGEPEEENRDPLRVMEKRYKDVQAWATKVAQQNAELQARMEALEQALAQAGGAPEEVPGGDAAEEDLLGEIREEYPEIAEFVEKQIGEKIQPIMQAQQQLAVERFVAAVQAQHQDAFEVDQSPEFRSWMQERGLWDHYDAAVKTLDAQKVGSYLALFKELQEVQQLKARADQARATTRSERRKAASAALESGAKGGGRAGPRAQTTRKFTREQLARMSPEEFEAHEAEIDAALAQGLIE